VHQPAVTGDTRQDTRRSSDADGKPGITPVSPHFKMLATKEPLTQNRLCRFNNRRNRTNRAFCKINACHRLLDVQWPGFSGPGIDMIPVIKPKRHVTVFLEFENHHLAQRMDRPGFDNDAVAGLWAKAGKEIRHRCLRNRLSQFLPLSAPATVQAIV
jgi:hypothetical protein